MERQENGYLVALRVNLPGASTEQRERTAVAIKDVQSTSTADNSPLNGLRIFNEVSAMCLKMQI